MTGEVRIVHVERDGDDGVLVTFSDGTVAGYVAEELLKLRPLRENSGNSESLGIAGKVIYAMEPAPDPIDWEKRLRESPAEIAPLLREHAIRMLLFDNAAWSALVDIAERVLSERRVMY